MSWTGIKRKQQLERAEKQIEFIPSTLELAPEQANMAECALSLSCTDSEQQEAQKFYHSSPSGLSAPQLSVRQAPYADASNPDSQLQELQNLYDISASEFSGPQPPYVVDTPTPDSQQQEPKSFYDISTSELSGPQPPVRPSPYADASSPDSQHQELKNMYDMSTTSLSAPQPSAPRPAVRQSPYADTSSPDSQQQGVKSFHDISTTSLPPPRLLVRQSPYASTAGFASGLSQADSQAQELQGLYNNMSASEAPPRSCLASASTDDYVMPLQQVATPQLSMSAHAACAHPSSASGSAASSSSSSTSCFFHPAAQQHQPVHHFCDGWAPKTSPHQFQHPLMFSQQQQQQSSRQFSPVQPLCACSTPAFGAAVCHAEQPQRVRTFYDGVSSPRVPSEHCARAPYAHQFDPSCAVPASYLNSPCFPPPHVPRLYMTSPPSTPTKRGCCCHHNHT